MPTYEYRCKNCGHELEAVQKFSDAPLTVCPNCEGELRKVFSPVGVVFKGSGFYRTDSRTSGSETSAGSKAADKKASGDAAASTGSINGSGKDTTKAPSTSGAAAASSGAAKPSGASTSSTGGSAAG